MIICEYDRLVASLKRGHIPTENQLQICNDDGIPIAHAVVKEYRMPANWSGWTVADIDGWTAAHVAATEGMLPSDFIAWDLVDNEGTSVYEVHVRVDDLRNDRLESEILDGGGLPNRLWDHVPIENPSEHPKKGINDWLNEARALLATPVYHKKAI